MFSSDGAVGMARAQPCPRQLANALERLAAVRAIIFSVAHMLWGITRSPNSFMGACLYGSSESCGMSRLEIVIRFCVDRMVVVFLLAAANIGGGI